MLGLADTFCRFRTIVSWRLHDISPLFAGGSALALSQPSLMNVEPLPVGTKAAPCFVEGLFSFETLAPHRSAFRIL
jgi:hypothetical protein